MACAPSLDSMCASRGGQEIKQLERRQRGHVSDRGLVWLVSGLLLGCTGHGSDDAGETTAQPPAPVAVAASQIGDDWVGRWYGPEGTYLDIAGDDGVYTITIMNLDAARSFEGAAVGDHIEFERDGVRESLRATNGDDTGMKWLAGKQDCLTVKRGEGYCRD